MQYVFKLLRNTSVVCLTLCAVAIGSGEDGEVRERSKKRVTELRQRLLTSERSSREAEEAVRDLLRSDESIQILTRRLIQEADVLSRYEGAFAKLQENEGEPSSADAARKEMGERMKDIRSWGYVDEGELRLEFLSTVDRMVKYGKEDALPLVAPLLKETSRPWVVDGISKGSVAYHVAGFINRAGIEGLPRFDYSEFSQNPAYSYHEIVTQWLKRRKVADSGSESKEERVDSTN